MNAAARLLEPNRPEGYEGPDGAFLVDHVNRRCCEFAVSEATRLVGASSAAKVRSQAWELVSGQESPDLPGACQTPNLINYAMQENPRIDGLGCHLHGNGSLAFIVAAANSAPKWVTTLIGRPEKLPVIAIIDSKVSPGFETIQQIISAFNLSLFAFLGRVCFHHGRTTFVRKPR